MVNLNWAQFEMLTVFYIYVSFAFKNPLSEDQIPSKKKKKKKNIQKKKKKEKGKAGLFLYNSQTKTCI